MCDPSLLAFESEALHNVADINFDQVPLINLISNLLPGQGVEVKKRS